MSRIIRFEVGRFDYNLMGEFKFFKAPVRPSIVVRLTDENGIQGWGQSVPVETWTYETVETVETTLRHYLAPAVCKAAVDLACYDLWGEQAHRSVSEILGGASKKQVKLSWTVQSPTMAGAETQLALAKTRGYDSFNIKLGYPQTPTPRAQRRCPVSTPRQR